MGPKQQRATDDQEKGEERTSVDRVPESTPEVLGLSAARVNVLDLVERYFKTRFNYVI